MSVTVENLSFSYDGSSSETLKEISVSIKSGKFTGILGPNGCGKSTLLKNITGYLKHNKGDILINDQNISSFTRKEIAKKIALVPQKSHLSSAISVEDFVIMGRLPHLKSTWDGYRKEDRTVAEKNIELLDLEKFEKRVALSLSGGEFQRVLLARALTQEPEILFLDEPTSALDINHAVELLSQVKTLIKDKNMTGVAVLHDLNLAAMFCHELIIMKDGKILYQGTPKEVIREDILKEVYNLKSRVILNEDGIPYVIPLI